MIGLSIVREVWAGLDQSPDSPPCIISNCQGPPNTMAGAPPASTPSASPAPSVPPADPSPPASAHPAP